MKSLRQELLDAAKEKPIRKFTQFDFEPNYGDPEDTTLSPSPDQDGDLLMGGHEYELRNTDFIRVQIPTGANPEDTIRGLEKIIQWIRQQPEFITDGWGYAEKHTPRGWIVEEPESGLKWPKDNYTPSAPDDLPF